MRRPSVWARLVGAQGAVVEGVDLDKHPGGGGVVLVVSVRVSRRGRSRCGVCQRRCPGYDRGAGRRRWRALDLGTGPAVIEAEAPRVTCPRHGVVVAAVPWARHQAGHTRDFDDTVAWLAVATSKSAVCELLRIAWRTVGAIITRVEADFTARTDRLAGLRGSASMRSATRRATSTSPSWSTTTPDAWSGPRPAGTRRPCTPSSTPSAPGVPGS